MTSSTGPVCVDNPNDEVRDLTEGDADLDDVFSQASLEPVAVDGRLILGLDGCRLLSAEANELTRAGWRGGRTGGCGMSGTVDGRFERA